MTEPVVEQGVGSPVHKEAVEAGVANLHSEQGAVSAVIEGLKLDLKAAEDKAKEIFAKIETETKKLLGIKEQIEVAKAAPAPAPVPADPVATKAAAKVTAKQKAAADKAAAAAAAQAAADEDAAADKM